MSPDPCLLFPSLLLPSLSTHPFKTCLPGVYRRGDEVDVIQSVCRPAVPPQGVVIRVLRRRQMLRMRDGKGHADVRVFCEEESREMMTCV